MTAHKPRVYVMESQSFNLTPPLRLFLPEVPTLEEIHANVGLGAPYFFLEMLVAWC